MLGTCSPKLVSRCPSWVPMPTKLIARPPKVHTSLLLQMLATRLRPKIQVTAVSSLLLTTAVFLPSCSTTVLMAGTVVRSAQPMPTRLLVSL